MQITINYLIFYFVMGIVIGFIYAIDSDLENNDDGKNFIAISFIIACWWLFFPYTVVYFLVTGYQKLFKKGKYAK